MRVTVVGAGAIGLGTAALLCRDGHAVTIWSPTGRTTDALAAGLPLASSGAVVGLWRPHVARGAAEALAAAEAAIVCVPGWGQRATMDALASHLRPEQVVIVSGQLSLSALYFSRQLAARGASATIAAWGTTVVAGRRAGPAEVEIAALRATLDVATLPVAAADRGIAVCRALFGDRFETRADLLAIQLSNLNPPSHMANALANFTRIERGETWRSYGGITPSVGRLVEALDVERLALARAFGVAVRTIHDHMHLSFGVRRGTVAAMAAEIALRRGGGPAGPTAIDTRFVTEDVPFGLVPLAALGRLAGVATPLHDAGIALFSALYARDFAAENDLLPALAIDSLGLAELSRRARAGWPAA